MNHLPKLVRPPSTTMDQSIHFSPILAEVAPLNVGDVLSRMKSSLDGLSEGEAARRLAELGPNVVAASTHRGWPWRLLGAARNPPSYC